MFAPVGFKEDHFIYQVDRASRGRDGRCSRCGTAFAPGEHVRVPGDLNDDGWWHETCVTALANAVPTEGEK